MEITDIVTTICVRCDGTARVELKRNPRPPKAKRQYVPCEACGQTGSISRTIEDRCYRMLAAVEPHYLALRAAPVMAAEAIAFTEVNPWCSIAKAIQIQYQGNEFHTGSIRREKRNHLRQEAGESWRGQRLGRIPDRRTLMLRVADRAGFRNLGDFGAAQYKRGHVSPTLYAQMNSTDVARMQFQLGFASMSGGILHPTLTRLGRG